MKRMSEVTDVHGWVYLDEENRTADNADNLHFKNVPKGVQVFEITGPMFLRRQRNSEMYFLTNQQRCLLSE